MRFNAWTALAACIWVTARAAPSAAAALPLEECRLEHPLKIVSVPARCGRLTVPEDPAASAGQTIDLFVAVIPALNRRAAFAPLFLLAGGPGQSAADLYASYAGAFSKINRNHDIVLVDQRGTGRSNPLTCDYAEDWQSSAADLTALRRSTEACLSKYGDRVRYYTTSAAVGDLDRVRSALGYAVIDLYGSSYGTRVAQLYMRRYPKSTHLAILDGVTYPAQAIGPDTPFDGERALDLILGRCRAAPACAAAYPDLMQDFNALRGRFGTGKIALTLTDPTTGAPLPIEFDRSVFAAALRLLSYNATEASLLPALIHEAAQGRLAPLAAQTVLMARQVQGQLASGMQNSVVCSEDVPFFDSPPLERAKIAATYQGTDQLDGLAEICKIWPRGPVDPDLHSALHSAVPTLLLSGDLDPVTPPADAERAAQGLTRHRHLILSGEGHGQVATGCMPTLLAQFLDNGDPDSLDASCLHRHRPAPFFVGLTGPAP